MLEEYTRRVTEVTGEITKTNGDYTLIDLYAASAEAIGKEVLKIDNGISNQHITVEDGRLWNEMSVIDRWPFVGVPCTFGVRPTNTIRPENGFTVTWIRRDGYRPPA